MFLWFGCHKRAAKKGENELRMAVQRKEKERKENMQVTGYAPTHLILAHLTFVGTSLSWAYHDITERFLRPCPHWSTVFELLLYSVLFELILKRVSNKQFMIVVFGLSSI